MSSLKVTVGVERDGVSLSGYPIVKRVEVDEDTGQWVRESAYDEAFVAVPGDGYITTKQVLIMETDKATDVRFGSGAAGDCGLVAGGLIIIVGMSETDVELDNTHASETATWRGLVAGT